MPQKHYIEVKANEEAYAAASGSAYERTEAAATSYPVRYPEPFATLGCGYGRVGAFVVRAGQEAANEAGLDWECTNQIHVQFTLSGGTEQQYAQFEKALQERLELVKKWVEFRPKYAMQTLKGKEMTAPMETNQPAAAPATKLIEVRLCALTSMDYSEVVEVPVDFTHQETDQLVDRRYREVGGGEFTGDPDYWERGTCYATDPESPNEPATVRVSRGEGGELTVEELLEEDDAIITVEGAPRVVAPVMHPSTSAESGNAGMLVSLDGGQTFVPVTDGVRIIYKNVAVPGEDEPGELHLNATSEGLISDLWVSRDEHLDHNLGTSSQMVDDLVDRLVDDPVDEDGYAPRPAG